MDLKRNKLVVRFLAFLLDYIVIFCYMVLIAVLSYTLNQHLPFWDKMEESYFLRHGVSFLTLTLPVYLYFYKMESGTYKGTLGKWFFNLEVQSVNSKSKHNFNVCLRNIYKFLPWEFYHFLIHINSISLYSSSDISYNTLILLNIPLLIMLVYILYILIRKDHRSVYELLSDTKVKFKKE